MLQRRWQGLRRSPAWPLACRGGTRYQRVDYHVVAMLLVFATVVRAARAEPPAEDLPRVDQCRTAYVCEPGTELLQTRDGAVCINREVQPGHDECRLRYAWREMPFPLFRLRSHAQSELFLPPCLDLQGIDADGRPWFLGGEPAYNGKAGGTDVFWIDSAPSAGGSSRAGTLACLPAKASTRHGPGPGQTCCAMPKGRCGSSDGTGFTGCRPKS